MLVDSSTLSVTFSFYTHLLTALDTGWDFYVGSYKNMRNKTANMDVLVAMGSSVAYFYSIVVTAGFLGGHVYFETSAAIITLIKVGKLLEARAKGKTSEATAVEHDHRGYTL